MNFDIYCSVIDNYGDAGVSLRLSRELKRLGAKVRLFCDDLNVLRTIAVVDDEDATLRFLPFCAEESILQQQRPDVVVAAFACHLPALTAKLINAQGCLVLYLDYLSAENWVESFHGLPAPAEFVRGYYFYPGFTKRTGGLLFEPRLRQLAQSAAQAQQQPLPAVRQLTLFSYANPAVAELLTILEGSVRPSAITVFGGKPLDNVNAILGMTLQPSDSCTLGKLTFKAQGMVSQDDYDALLCQSELNLVRGEDSIVRALCCGRPCLWQIYPQTQDAHIAKLQALLDCFKRELPSEKQAGLAELNAMMLSYNGRAKWPQFNFDDFEPIWRKLALQVQNYIFSLPNLAESMLNFCRMNMA